MTDRKDIPAADIARLRAIVDPLIVDLARVRAIVGLLYEVDCGEGTSIPEAEWKAVSDAARRWIAAMEAAIDDAMESDEDEDEDAEGRRP